MACVLIHWCFHFLRQTISFWETMWTVESSLWKWCVCFSHTKSSIQKTFSCCVATMSALESTGFMDFTTNVVADSRLRCGKRSVTPSTVFLAVPLLTTRLFACMVGYLRSCRKWNKSPTFPVHATFLIRGYCVTFFGPIPIQASRLVLVE
jgi:hypothetical protein